MTLPNPIAIQMWTLRDLVAADFADTLRQVARIGYGAVEFAGYGDLPAADVRRMMDDLGLVPAGAHVGIAPLEEDFDRVADFHLELGCTNIIVPGPPAGFERTAANWAALGSRIAALLPLAARRGIALHYHNHGGELARFDGRPALDILLQTAGAGLGAEIDVYWVKFAGDDPAEAVSRRAGTCHMVHLKDMAHGATPRDVEVGEGVLDWPSIFHACREAGVEWYVVEMDNCPKPPLESIELALRNLRRMGIVS